VNYTVIWLESAEVELADLWLNAPDRERVTAAAHELDIRLGANPGIEGESRKGNRRILLVAPLGVTYEVHPDDRLVRVLEVWRFRTPFRGASPGSDSGFGIQG